MSEETTASFMKSRELIESLWKAVEDRRLIKRKPKCEGVIFISYHNSSLDAALKMNDDLRLKELETFFDRYHMELGEHLDNIAQSIINCKIFLPIISKELLEAIETAEREHTEAERLEKMPYSYKHEWSVARKRYDIDLINKRFNFKIVPCVVGGVSQQDARIPKFFKDQRIYILPDEAMLLVAQIVNSLCKT